MDAWLQKMDYNITVPDPSGPAVSTAFGTNLRSGRADDQGVPIELPQPRSRTLDELVEPVAETRQWIVFMLEQDSAIRPSGTENNCSK